MSSPLRLLLMFWLLTVAAGAMSALAADVPAQQALETALARALDGKQTRIEPVDPSGLLAPAVLVSAAPLATFMRLFTYLLLAAGLVLLVTIIVQRIHSGRGTRPTSTAGEDAAAAAADTPGHGRDSVPEAAARAAARGEYGEALRLLLGEVLLRFYRGKGPGWPESWTSRQCLRRLADPGSSRADLAELVATVERHHFGGLPAVVSDWEHWRRLAPGLRPASVAEVKP